MQRPMRLVDVIAVRLSLLLMPLALVLPMTCNALERGSEVALLWKSLTPTLRTRCKSDSGSLMPTYSQQSSPQSRPPQRLWSIGQLV